METQAVVEPRPLPHPVYPAGARPELAPLAREEVGGSVPATRGRGSTAQDPTATTGRQAGCGMSEGVGETRGRPGGRALRPVREQSGFAVRSDLIGPERSEGPYVAPRAQRAKRVRCAHAGHTPCKTPLSRPAAVAAPAQPEGSRSRGVERYEWRRTADTVAGRVPARLRDALHGDDGRPGNGRVGAP